MKTLIENVKDGDHKNYVKLRDFYNDCNNEEKLEEQGWEPLKQLLDDVGIDLNDQSDASVKDWFEYIYQIRKLGGYDDIFFTVDVICKPEDQQIRMIQIFSDCNWMMNDEPMKDMLEKLNVEQVNRDIIINDVKELHENFCGPLPKLVTERGVMQHDFNQNDVEYSEAIIIPTG